MDDISLMKAFDAGAAAALVAHGAGRWKNPYLPLITDARIHRQPTYKLQEMADMWDEGWSAQTAKMRMDLRAQGSGGGDRGTRRRYSRFIEPRRQPQG